MANFTLDDATPAPATGFSPVPTYISLFILMICSWNVWCYLSSPLRYYPGPWLAKWTNLWRFYHVVRDRYPNTCLELHKRYGPVVCVGPNVLDVADIEVLKVVFNQDRGQWRKSIFYEIAGAKNGTRVVHHLFSERNPDRHAATKKPIARYYTMSNILAMEPHFDSVINTLCFQIENRFARTAKSFDLSDWLGFYSWDAIGTVAFSKTVGYLDKGCDFDGTLARAYSLMRSFINASMLPWFGHYVFPIPYLQVPGLTTVLERSINRLKERVAQSDEYFRDPGQPDLLDKFLETKAVYPQTADETVVGWIMSLFLAGADSTTSALCSAMYHVVRDRAIWTRLRSELDEAAFSCPPGQPMSYQQARSSPYLEAVIRESLRILPGVSMPLERDVPTDGFTLPSGGFVPKGVTLGVNPYIMARDSAYGPDADEFRPERWLQGPDEAIERYQERLSAMNAADFVFGGGARRCIGENLALIQLHKLVATLVTQFDIELVNPQKEWSVQGAWFPHLSGIEVKASKRT